MARNTSKLLTQINRDGHQIRITFCQWLVFSRYNNFSSFINFKIIFFIFLLHYANTSPCPSFLNQTTPSLIQNNKKTKQKKKKEKKLQKKKISARFSVLGVASKLDQIDQNLPRNHFWSQGIGGQI